MDQIPTRYIMNQGIMTRNDITKMNNVHVAIVGLGGLGGNVANQLLRLGVTHFSLIDFDVFTESNLNRQLFSNMHNLGLKKVNVLKSELLRINPAAKIKVFEKEVQQIELLDCDYIIDCVDNIETKKYLVEYCEKHNYPLLHGSCGGWYGQVGWFSPGNSLLLDVYQESNKGIEEELFNPVFAPAVVASYMCSEFVKMITASDQIVLDELLLIDLYNNVTIKTKRRT